MFGLGAPSILIVTVFLLPFVLNTFLAEKKGKSVALMLLLTVIFSWIVTLILACMPDVKEEEK